MADPAPPKPKPAPTPAPPSPPPPSGISAALRHPLAGVVVAFILTGVVGTTLSNHLNNQRHEAAEAVRLRDARRVAVKEMARALSERLLRIEMVITAIERKSSPAVVAELYQAHLNAETKWYSGRAEVFILAREVLGEADYKIIRSELENRLVRQRLVPLRECLRRACEKVAEGQDGAADLAQCRATQLLNELHAGTEALVDGLYDLASITLLHESDPEAVQVRKRVLEQLEAACP